MLTQGVSIRRSKQHVTDSHSAAQHSEVPDDSDTSQIFRACMCTFVMKLEFQHPLSLLCPQLLQIAFPPRSVGNTGRHRLFNLWFLQGYSAVPPRNRGKIIMPGESIMPLWESLSHPLLLNIYTEGVTRFPSEVGGSIGFVTLCMSARSQSQP